MLQKIKTTSNCAITTVLSRVGKRVTVRVGKISLRVGSCPPLPTLSYATAYHSTTPRETKQSLGMMVISSHSMTLKETKQSLRTKVKKH